MLRLSALYAADMHHASHQLEQDADMHHGSPRVKQTADTGNSSTSADLAMLFKRRSSLAVSR